MSTFKKNKKTGLKEFIIQTENNAMDAIESLGNNASTWEISRKLRERVGSDLKLKDFYGDSINFLIDENFQKFFSNLKNQLLSLDMFAEKINDNLLHMVVHELSCGKKNKKLDEKINTNLQNSQEIFLKIREFIFNDFKNTKINMRASVVFPLNNLAVACAMIPKEDKDHQVLMEIFERFEEVVPLRDNHGFYVVLNYFQPRIFRQMEISDLYALIKNLKVNFEIEFDIGQLVYQRYTNLNCYQTLIRI